MNKAEVLKAITAGFRSEFNQGLAGVAPTYSKVAMDVPSSTSTNNYAWLSAFPQMREWVSSRQRKKMGKQAMALENKLYEATVEVPRTAIEDDQYGIYSVMSRQAGQSAALLPDQLTWGLLPNGKTTLCYDGQNFFDTDHPVYPNVDGTGTAVDTANLTTGTDATAKTWYVIDDTQVVKPLIYQNRTDAEFEAKFDPSKSDTVFMEDIYLYGARRRGNAGFALWQLAHMVEQTELTAEALLAVKTKMSTLKGDGGELLGVRPSLLVVPPSLEHKAKQILKADQINGTTNVLKDTLDIHVEPRLEA